MNLFQFIKKNVKILNINGNTITIGTKKGFWSKGLEFGNKGTTSPIRDQGYSSQEELQ